MKRRFRRTDLLAEYVLRTSRFFGKIATHLPGPRVSVRAGIYQDAADAMQKSCSGGGTTILSALADDKSLGCSSPEYSVT